MVRQMLASIRWGVAFLCSCSAAVPSLPVQQKDANVLVVRPAGYQPVQISPEEYRDGMRMLCSRGPLPGVPRRDSLRFVLASADPCQLQKAAGYLQHCERLGKGRGDCWEALAPSGGLDESGTRDVALRFAFSEAVQDAATAVGSLTPDQVRAILAIALVGAIVSLVSPDPVTKYLFIVTSTNLIAFVGVDYFFGRVTSSQHNQARSLQNRKDLETLGIREAEGGREKLLRLFEKGLESPELERTVDQYGTTVVRTVKLPGGAIDVSYLYRPGVEVPEVTTIIPKIFR
ncbi:MAG TPA: hypothetical protein VFU03_01850 [Gemmatimonadales bacterium]|nr:hypothetical protein [Gemmatimonadales bacterium]